MTDIRLRLKKTTDLQEYYDFNLVNGDFEEEKGLDTAITLSLLEEKRDTTIDNPENRGGWWGNAILPDGFEQGSLVWTKYQSDITQEVLEDVDTYITDGLQWLIGDGIASNVDNTVFSDTDKGVIAAEVDINRKDNSSQSSFFELWNFTGDNNDF